MHTIKFVAQQTGLSQHTIRAWERRYGALTPERTLTNRRLYSAEDLEKLSLLRKAVGAGHSIGQIAALSLNELKSLQTDSAANSQRSDRAASTAIETPQRHPYLEDCLRAIEQLDAEALEYCLTRSAAMLGAAAMINQVMIPLLNSIGESWREGDLRPAHEHMATAILRTFLGGILASFQPSSDSPRLIVTTPVGQIHELGALIAGVTAASEGWTVLYLGPNLPATEIAGAARQSGAAAVALSIVYPPDDARLAQEITALRKFIGNDMPILAGGRAAVGYRTALDSIGAILTEDFQTLRQELEAVRSR